MAKKNRSAEVDDDEDTGFQIRKDGTSREKALPLVISLSPRQMAHVTECATEEFGVGADGKCRKRAEFARQCLAYALQQLGKPFPS